MFIYEIHNVVNNKKYIGQTTQQLQNRWRSVLALRKIPYPTIISPAGKEHTITNLRALCVRYKLRQSSMVAMLQGRYQHCQGWHLPGIVISDEKRSLKVAKARRPQGYPALKSPN